MSFSYDKNLSTDKDILRFKLQDNDEETAFFEDEELEGLITIYGGWKRAVIECCYSLAALFAAQPDNVSLGIQSISYAGKAKYYTELADILRTQIYRTLSCHATGVYTAQVQFNRERDDIVHNAFRRNQMSRYEREAFVGDHYRSEFDTTY